MRDTGHSLTQMETFQTFLRWTYGRDAVESYAQKKLVKMTHEMDDFFEATDQEFEEKEKDDKVSKTVTRTLIVVKDSSEVIYHLHEKLNLDIHDSNIKLGFDDGGGCLKVS